MSVKTRWCLGTRRKLGDGDRYWNNSIKLKEECNKRQSELKKGQIVYVKENKVGDMNNTGSNPTLIFWPRNYYVAGK